jgi:hypothetical protein
VAIAVLCLTLSCCLAYAQEELHSTLRPSRIWSIPWKWRQHCDPKCEISASPTVYLRASIFWDVTRRRLIVGYWRFGTTCGVPSASVKQSETNEATHPSHLSWTVWPLKMVRIVFSKRR